MHRQDSHGDTLLHVVAKLGWRAEALAVLKRLLDLEADPHLPNGAGITALMLVLDGFSDGAPANHKLVAELVSAMLLIPGNLDAVDQRGDAALMRACRAGALEIAMMLVEAGAGCDRVDQYGRTLLMLAVFRSDPRLLAFLLEQKIPIDAKDNNGNTVLHYAAGYDKAQCIALLLEHGANWRIANHKEALPAVLSTDPAVLALFAAWAARQAVREALGQSAPGRDVPAPRHCGPAT
jgi:ankyrin repeat protein